MQGLPLFPRKKFAAIKTGAALRGQAHMGVAQMYVDDPRFGEYYDRIAPGCAVFLRDAAAIYCR